MYITGKVFIGLCVFVGVITMFLVFKGEPFIVVPGGYAVLFACVMIYDFFMENKEMKEKERQRAVRDIFNHDDEYHFIKISDIVKLQNLLYENELLVAQREIFEKEINKYKNLLKYLNKSDDDISKYKCKGYTTLLNKYEEVCKELYCNAKKASRR